MFWWEGSSQRSIVMLSIGRYWTHDLSCWNCFCHATHMHIILMLCIVSATAHTSCISINRPLEICWAVQQVCLCLSTNQALEVRHQEKRNQLSEEIWLATTCQWVFWYLENESQTMGWGKSKYAFLKNNAPLAQGENFYKCTLACA